MKVEVARACHDFLDSLRMTFWYCWVTTNLCTTRRETGTIDLELEKQLEAARSEAVVRFRECRWVELLPLRRLSRPSRAVALNKEGPG